MAEDAPPIQHVVKLMNAGKLEQASAVCQRILDQRADDAPATHLMGLIAHHRGSNEAAIRLMRRSLQLNNKQALWHFNLGVVFQAGGMLNEAADCYRQSIRLAPRSAPAYNNLGTLLHRSGRYEEAIGVFGKALACDQKHADAHANIGTSLLELGRFGDAESHFRSAISLEPQRANFHLGLGDAYRLQQKLDAAAECYRRAIKHDEKFASAYRCLAMICRERGEARAAEQLLQKAVALNPHDAAALLGLAVVFKEQGRLDDAEAGLRKSLAISPNDPDAIAAFAGLLEMRGRYEEAWQQLGPLVEITTPNINVAMAFSSLSVHLDRTGAAVRLNEKALDAGRLNDLQRTLLHFATGKLLDGSAEYPRAFEHYHKANALKPYHFDADKHDQYVQQIMTTFGRDAMGRLSRGLNPSDRPIFIVGMPRSGTTLIEQIISAHPQISGGGELHDLMRLANLMHKLHPGARAFPQGAADVDQARIDHWASEYLARLEKISHAAARVTDKLPANFLHLGLIEMMLPGARVIHCKRDPRDTCLSCYFQNFAGRHAYAYSLAALGRYYRAYERLMAHWPGVISLPMMTVVYEDVVADPASAARRLIEFCGLAWDDQCLRFHETGRDVATASYAQVRRPVYDTSIGRWRNYEKYLGPLLEALQETNP